ncbi:MAG: hypothetical protein HOG34_09685 [Bacteroidetes bacterium]|nr:hypothetical protein [Bacteroidota bacterium]
MSKNRCPAHCGCNSHFDRRSFLKGSTIALAGTAILGSYGISGCTSTFTPAFARIRPAGPGSQYTPRIKAAFIRRKEDYGMWWPGAVYDGEAAREKYTKLIRETADEKGIDLSLRAEPIFSHAEADQWIAEAQKQEIDGLVLLLLDRQQHTWPTVQKATDSGIPSVIFSPLGTSFTTNTVGLAEKPGRIIYSTNDFSQAQYGLQMLKAAARMRRSRCLVIAGKQERVQQLADTGITLQYIPADRFLETYNSLKVDDELENMADDYIRQSRKQVGATREDVINGIKSYKVAGSLLEEYQGDAISMDCLGALANEPISLPCISWSRMNDDGIPAACEADTGAIASQIIVHYLFDRPGFQQDPVADTSDNTLIGAHCSSPTRLNGFDQDPEPFDLTHHHGNRDAVPRTIWKKGQRITCFDFMPAPLNSQESSKILVSAGTVVGNMNVPPSGGCVVSVKAKMDGNHNILAYPGFHQLFFYGDYVNQLTDFSQLCGFQTTRVT